MKTPETLKNSGMRQTGFHISASRGFFGHLDRDPFRNSIDYFYSPIPRPRKARSQL